MRTGTVTLPEGRLETGWWGPGPDDAPTLVLLHEGLGCVELWRDVPERLAAATGWGVFAYSRFGYGQSEPTALPRPMTYMQQEALTVLPKVLGAAGIRRAVLIGHSDGGSIATVYAGAFPHGSAAATAAPISPALASPASVSSSSDRARQEGLVRPFMTVSGGVPQILNGRHDPRSRAQAPSHDPVAAAGERETVLLGLATIAAHFFVEDVNITSIQHIKQAYETSDLRARLGRYHRDVDMAFRGWNDAWLDPRFRAFDITAFLPEIRVPILALQGADDPYGSNEQLRVMQTQVHVPIDVELISGARHAPHLEAPEATLSAITRFIAALARENPT
ncbi:alpha/beta fold hydrolase [Rhodopila sp.]|uniref:alpha/beta fold hydrolase n=1 Tax=Rhodopila sp. TaxID=2480087 RepID=UPI003D0C2097